MHADADSGIEMPAWERYWHWERKIEEANVKEVVCDIDVTFANGVSVSAHAAAIGQDQGAYHFK